MTMRRSLKYFKEIYSNVWLMDNHKWAFYIWESCRLRNPNIFPSTLVHIDYHWDGINDFSNPRSVKRLINVQDSQSLLDFVTNTSFIRFDSFIAPSIIRGSVKEIHFYCLDYDNDIALDEELLRQCHAKQFVYKNIDSLIQHVSGKSIVFDIDLDIFNKSDKWEEGNIWDENDILKFVDKCTSIIANSALVTIATSTGYSGNNKDTEYLTDLVVPRIVSHKTR